VFDVGFTSEFGEMISYDQTASVVRYSLSPSLRASYNFTGYICIKVSATVVSEYGFYTRVSR
jgi:hypothetical protein